jgi:hypothetical protein
LVGSGESGMSGPAEHLTDARGVARFKLGLEESVTDEL